jgi:hypothetical protein
VVIHLLRSLIAAEATSFVLIQKKQKNQAVAITCTPSNPTLARAQQRAFALFILYYVLDGTPNNTSLRAIAKQSLNNAFRTILRRDCFVPRNDGVNNVTLNLKLAKYNLLTLPAPVWL